MAQGCVQWSYESSKLKRSTCFSVSLSVLCAFFIASYWNFSCCNFCSLFLFFLFPLSSFVQKYRLHLYNQLAGNKKQQLISFHCSSLLQLYLCFLSMYYIVTNAGSGNAWVKALPLCRQGNVQCESRCFYLLLLSWWKWSWYHNISHETALFLLGWN